MPERPLACANQTSEKLCRFSFILLSSSSCYSYTTKHGENFFKKEREEEMKHPKRSKINEPFTDGTPGKPTHFAFSQGLRQLLEYLVFDDINQ